MRLRGWYGTHLRSHLPTGMRVILHEASERYDLWHLRPLPTKMSGPRWRRSRVAAALDITYACDLACPNCNRSCSQAPSGDHMSLGQVVHFIEESRARGIRWKRIRLAGGEPTCHPQFHEVVEAVARYRDEFSPETLITVLTNGYSERARKAISRLPAGVRVENSYKTSSRQSGFVTFNVAPIDTRRFRKADFSNGCLNTALCGMGVTPYGYYPCAIAGAIDRTFGFDLGRKTIPEDRDDMTQELRTFCAVCGMFKKAFETRDAAPEGPVMSPTWADAYERSRRNPARLSRLGEHEALGSDGG